MARRSVFKNLAAPIRFFTFLLVGSLAMMLPLQAVEFTVSPDKLIIETQKGPVSFSVELADTQEERAVGLMNRTEMARDHGMLFDFEQNRDVLMWMKNTILPLDMLFIRPDGVIEAIAADTVPFSEAIIASPGPIRYVLEINAGEAASQGILPGDQVIHPGIEIY